MRLVRYLAFSVVLALLVALTAPVHVSAQPSIPINGRFSSLVISISIPESPTWAHDLVVNATIAWNLAQLWQSSAGP
ncbi:MAG: hypothetical protein WB661_06320, partial [Candidatus Bathyarchaeia archaeon]